MTTSSDAKQTEVCHFETTYDAAPDSNEAGVLKTLLCHPRIIALCLFANLGAIMYGFDNLALSLCLSTVPFQKQFGTLQQLPSGPSYVIPAYWQSLWGAMAQVATALGALVIGSISDRFGRRLSFFLAGAISSAGIAVLFTASHPGTFLAGKMVNGIALGMAMSTGQTYVSEIAPLKIRGILLSAYAFCMNIGLLIAASISFSRVSIMTPSAYKVLFAIGWVWSGLLVTLVWIIPESPHYFIRKSDLDAARRCFGRLFGSDINITASMEEAVRTHTEEKALATSAQDATYLECFRGTNWRRTRVVLYCNGLSQMVGATFVANSPYFLVSAGMTPSHVALVIQIGMALGCVSMLLTFFLIGRWNRRTVTLSATAICALIYLPMGIAGCFPRSTTALWIVGCLLQVVQFVGLGPAVGPAIAIAGEVSALRLRSKTQSLGFFFNYSYSTIWNVVVPYMFNVDEGNLGGKIGFIFFATCLIAVAAMFWELPETKDITYEHLDMLFAKKVPPRRFQSQSHERSNGAAVFKNGLT